VGNNETGELTKKVALLTRQLSMAKAREKGLRNRLESTGIDPDKVAAIEVEDTPSVE
jgi:hypothetical protein